MPRMSKAGDTLIMQVEGNLHVGVIHQHDRNSLSPMDARRDGDNRIDASTIKIVL